MWEKLYNFTYRCSSVVGDYLSTEMKIFWKIVVTDITFLKAFVKTITFN